MHSLGVVAGEKLFGLAVVVGWASAAVASCSVCHGVPGLFLWILTVGAPVASEAAARMESRGVFISQRNAVASHRLCDL